MSSISAVGGTSFVYRTAAPTSASKVDASTSQADASTSPADASKGGGGDGASETAPKATSAGAASTQLTDEQKKVIEQLKQRDLEVRQHEQAHLAAAGAYARGGASFVYQVGPDGKQYAIGGEVQIDASPVSGDPRATIEKARQIRQAALAPAQPSGQDLAVAASAGQLVLQAQQELSGQTNAAGGEPAAEAEGSGAGAQNTADPTSSNQTKDPSTGNSASASEGSPSEGASVADPFSALVAAAFANRSGSRLNLLV